MTPKEKAIELVDKYRHFEYPSLIGSDINEIHKNPIGAAKQCALIAVDEILSLAFALHDFTETEFIKTDYWQQVKQEIEKPVG